MLNAYDFEISSLEKSGGVHTIVVECFSEELETGMSIEIQRYNSEEEKNPEAPSELHSSTLWKITTDNGDEFSVAEYVNFGNCANTSGEIPESYRNITNACQKWLGNQWIDVPKIPWKCFKN